MSGGRAFRPKFLRTRRSDAIRARTRRQASIKGRCVLLNVRSLFMTPSPAPQAPSAAAKKPSADVSIGRDRLLHMYRQMVAIRLFEERVNDLYTRALMPGLAHLYIGEEAIASASAKSCAATTTSPARIAATATAWPRARRPTACSPSSSARKPATARARAARCTSPIRTRATSAPTRSSAGAPASRPARHLRPST